MLEPLSDVLIVPPAAPSGQQTAAASEPRPSLPAEEVKYMLSFLDPNMGYKPWCDVGMALHAGGHPVELWDGWSKGAAAKYSEGECYSKWKSFKADGGITMATLVLMAQRAGYAPRDLPMLHGLPTLNPVSLQGKPIPERRWVVEDLIPFFCTTALYGDGGTGKSLLAMQLITSAALGRPWIGLPVTPLKVLGFFCEDTQDELHRRQERINAAYGCQFSDLGNIRWYSGVGEDNILMDYKSGEVGTVTRLYAAVEREALAFGAQLIVVDTAADTFGGNENARPQVRQFIGSLTKLALTIEGAVLLCAHPSLSGLNSGKGDGGNTAWNNSVRSRLYLHRPEEKDGGGLDNTDIRILSRKKSNYSRLSDDQTLIWRNGIFVPMPGTGPVSSPDQESRAKHAEEVFLKALDDIEAQGRRASSSKNAANFAPKLMLMSPHCAGLSRTELKNAMERLFNSNSIRDEQYGRSDTRRIVRVQPSKKGEGLA